MLPTNLFLHDKNGSWKLTNYQKVFLTWSSLMYTCLHVYASKAWQKWQFIQEKFAKWKMILMCNCISFCWVVCNVCKGMFLSAIPKGKEPTIILFTIGFLFPSYHNILAIVLLDLLQVSVSRLNKGSGQNLLKTTWSNRHWKKVRGPNVQNVVLKIVLDNNSTDINCF